MAYYAGIDVGGTKILTVITEDLKIIGKHKIKTKNGKSLIESISYCYQEALSTAKIDQKDISAVGIGMPSSINQETRKLLSAPNLGIADINIYDLLMPVFNKPLFIDNDVNMGIYGEYCCSDIKQFKSIYGIFLGTGVGGGYIANGTVVRGHGFTAGEIGHIIVNIDGRKCNCGNRGCLETIAGKNGIIQYIKKSKDKPVFLNKINPDWKKTLGYKDLYKAYIKGDIAVIMAVNNMAKAVGVTCANIINMIGADAIIIGGGAIDYFGSIIIDRIKRTAIKSAIGSGGDNVLIKPASLGENSVTLGCVSFVSDKNNKKFLVSP